MFLAFVLTTVMLIEWAARSTDLDGCIVQLATADLRVAAQAGVG